MEATAQTDSVTDQGASATKVMIMEQQGDSPRVRMILQQCMGAQLMVQHPSTTEDSPSQPQFVEIRRGLIVYICFMKGATKDHIEKMAKTALTVRLSESNDGKLVSLLDLPGDVLIIPQATLGGTIKGKVMQYHKNIAKEEGQQLYSEFVSIFKRAFDRNEKCQSSGTIVRYGTYGNRQVFSCQTNGPYTHLIEI